MANGRKWLGLTLALIIALGSLLPFFAVYNSTAAATQKTASVFGENILICTGEGFRWVKLSDLQSGKEKPAPHSSDKCPLCYMARHGINAVPVASAAPPAITQLPAGAVAYYHSPLLSLYRASLFNMRAPPVSFIG